MQKVATNLGLELTEVWAGEKTPSCHRHDKTCSPLTQLLSPWSLQVERREGWGWLRGAWQEALYMSTQQKGLGAAVVRRLMWEPPPSTQTSGSFTLEPDVFWESVENAGHPTPPTPIPHHLANTLWDPVSVNSPTFNEEERERVRGSGWDSAHPKWGLLGQVTNGLLKKWTSEKRSKVIRAHWTHFPTLRTERYSGMDAIWKRWTVWSGGAS